MIAYLKGSVKKATAEGIVLDVQGVGYLVLCPAPLIHKAGAMLGDLMEVWCVMQTREDNTTLYGLESFEARTLFLTITRIPGVGGRMALNLFSHLGFQGLIDAGLNSDHDAFRQAEGVGPKMAKRLSLELKGQEKKLLEMTASPEHLHDALASDSLTTLSPHLHDALNALVGLGYTQQETRPLVTHLLKEAPDLPLETLLQKALQRLATKVGRA